MKILLLIIILIISVILIIAVASITGRFVRNDEIKIYSELKEITKVNPIQIEILNATQENGIAKKIMVFLRNKNIDVVKIGNNTSLESRTKLIARTRDIKSCNLVADLIGINQKDIVSEIDTNMVLKCTLILGSDYKRLKPFKMLKNI